MTEKQKTWYVDAVAAFASGKGQRWELVTPMTFAAAALGVGVEELLDDCRAKMPDFSREHEANIRRGYLTAQAKAGSRQPRAYVPTATAPKPAENRDEVRRLIAAGGGSAELSPDTFAGFGGVPVAGLVPSEQTTAWLEHSFDPDALTFVTAKGRAENGRVCETASDYTGGNIRPCGEWLDMSRRGVPLPGDVLLPNPLSGERHETTDAQGQRAFSYILQTCVASVPYLVLELDDLPLKMQPAFWRGFLRASPLAPCLQSLVYSQGRSIHGLLRVDADALTWRSRKAQLVATFASDDTEVAVGDKVVKPFCADASAISPLTKTRIAGARRYGENEVGAGEVQTLLYLRKNATEPPATQPPAEPEAPPPPATATEPQTATACRWACDSCGCAARCREAWNRFGRKSPTTGKGATRLYYHRNDAKRSARARCGATLQP